MDFGDFGAIPNARPGLALEISLYGFIVCSRF